MNKILLVAKESRNALELISALSSSGYSPMLAPGLDKALQLSEKEAPAMVMLDFGIASNASPQLKELLQKCKVPPHVPVIALLSVERMATFDFALGVDDIMASPARPAEALARVKQMLARHKPANGKDVMGFGDLAIDTERYEVTLDGERVELTFKEYELLKFLAAAPGKVFTREMLLNKVWGYDYFGGTRTVDVHVRRLRSKIEDSNHSFIDTVRNVGYRFKDK